MMIRGRGSTNAASLPKLQAASLIFSFFICHGGSATVSPTPRILSTIMSGDSIHPSHLSSPSEIPAHRRDATTKSTKTHTQKLVREYKPYEYDVLVDALHELEQDFPDLVSLKSAQELYGLGTVGTEFDCPVDNAKGSYNLPGCKNWILTVEDEMAHPDGTILPEVFLSGSLHGDERVGPSASIEFAAVLLDAASCESLPRDRPPNGGDSGIVKDEYLKQLKTANKCRQLLKDKGIDDYHRKWMARLVATRRIVIVPSANALGYFNDEREEGGIDVNRDFPFDALNATCMTTVAARTINEVFRDHMFSTSISFHSGTEAISYSWASPDLIDAPAPDIIALTQISDGMSIYGGPTSFHDPPLNTNTINNLMKPFGGGMVDWAYAASWDTKFTKVCQDSKESTLAKYKKSQTTYKDHTNRALSFLVSSSRHRHPEKTHYGNDLDLFNPDSKGSGHIARSIRIASVLTDLTEPYVSLIGVNKEQIEDDIVPLRKTTFRSCIETKSFTIAKGKDVTVDWTVGGAFDVDRTVVLYAKWADLPVDYDGSSKPQGDDLAEFVSAIEGTDVKSSIRAIFRGGGRTKWHKRGPSPYDKKANKHGNAFELTLSMDDYEEGDKIAVFAVAEVDRSWANNVDDQASGPKSHLVNMRRDPDYKTVNGDGSLYWFSTPVTLVIGAEGTKTIQTSARFIKPSALAKLGHEVENDLTTAGGFAVLVGTICFMISAVMYFYKKRQQDKFGKQIDQGYYDDEFAAIDDFEMKGSTMQLM